MNAGTPPRGLEEALKAGRGIEEGRIDGFTCHHGLKMCHGKADDDVKDEEEGS